ncbi:MAG: TRZ/ATZ family hydrolase [Pseudomonadota bacterium]
MTPCDTLIFARWVCPVRPAGPTLDDHAVAIDAGRIVAVLPAADAAAAFSPRTTIERPHHLLTPGFVNAHTHAAMTLFRGMAEDVALDAWLSDTIWPAEAQIVGHEMVIDGTRLAIAEMLGGGTTCFADMYLFPDAAADVADECRMRAVLGLPVIDFPTAWARDPDEYFSRAVTVADRCQPNPLLTTQFAPHSAYAVSAENLARTRVLADQLDSRVHVHLHETAAEVSDSLSAHGVRPLQALQQAGLVNGGLVAAHAVHLSDDDLTQLAAAGVSVVHCPESNAKLASGLANVVRLRDAGVTVALGTDGAASNNDLDMLGEMRTAALLSRLATGNAAALTAADCLEMATLAGARALGLDAETGTIEPGKAADLACIDLRAAATWPVHDPVTHLVYSAGREQVVDTWVAGRALQRDGRLTGIDTGAVLDRSLEWLDRHRAC